MGTYYLESNGSQIKCCLVCKHHHIVIQFQAYHKILKSHKKLNCHLIDHIGPSLLQEMKNAHRQTLSFSLRQLLNCYSPQCFAHSLMLDGTHVQLYASKVLFTLTYIISMYVTLSWFYLCTSKCHKLESNRVIRKVIERGHMNSSLAKIGDETRNWA